MNTRSARDEESASIGTEMDDEAAHKAENGVVAEIGEEGGDSGVDLDGGDYANVAQKRIQICHAHLTHRRQTVQHHSRFHYRCARCLAAKYSLLLAFNTKFYLNRWRNIFTTTALSLK